MVRIDRNCRDQIQVKSETTIYKQRELMQTRASCIRCGGCVVELVTRLGNDIHLQNIAKAFCAPGEFQSRVISTEIITETTANPL